MFLKSLNNFLSPVYEKLHNIGSTLWTKLGIVGNACIALGKRFVTWITTPLHTTKKVNELGNGIIGNNNPQETTEPPLPNNGQSVPSPTDDHSAPQNETQGQENPLETDESRAPSPIESTHKITREEVNSVIKGTSPFNGYAMPIEGMVLTGVYKRPSSMLNDALFAGTSFGTTMPGGPLFALIDTKEPSKSAPRVQREIGNYLRQKASQSPDGEVSVSADSSLVKCRYYVHHLILSNGLEERNFKASDLFGTNTFRLSWKEVQEVIDSQEIFTSPFLPENFYRALKSAMLKDGLIELPGSESMGLVLLKEMTGHVKSLVEDASKDPKKYGFTRKEHFDTLKELTIYQIGSMVVKSEKCFVIIDGKMQIRERKVGDKDDIVLINACGIRGVSMEKTPQRYNRAIMKENFKTALCAAKNGFVVFPAVGMGIWRGDPDLYWNAFLEAIVESDQKFEGIFVNPGHRATPEGSIYAGKKGEEFQIILQKYKEKYTNDAGKLAKLEQIVDLFQEKSDVLELATHLKKKFPEQRVSVFNASDPDVTLGYHVGEYTNNFPHGITTEENYAAGTTSGLNFEGVTQIHDKKNQHKIIGMPVQDISKF